MKRLKQIFSYNPVEGVQAHPVRDQRRDTIVRINGIFGERLRIAELNKPNSRYFTKPALAIEAFIDKAEAAIADTSRSAASRKDWTFALTRARHDYSSQIVATSDV